MSTDVLRPTSSKKKRWRGSFMVHFGSEVGSSLWDLQQEYDDLITNFEAQKSRLREFSPKHETIREEQETQQSGPSSDTKSPYNAEKNRTVGIRRTKSASGVRLSVKQAQTSIKRKLSHRSNSSASDSPYRLRTKSGSTSNSSKDDIYDIDLVQQENDVFTSPAKTKLQQGRPYASTSNLLHEHGGFNTFLDKSKSASIGDKLYSTLPSKLKAKKNTSPANSSHTKPRPSTSKEHVLTPPVLVDGEMISNYQYFSPTRKVFSLDDCKEKSSSCFPANHLAKLLGRADNYSLPARKNKKHKSPLKALYDKTVLNAQDSDNEKSIKNRKSSGGRATDLTKRKQT
ncbi:uncharacterized protein LOC143449418 [Clavelina lepadiformis]|uniref:uncharacterized protein LOC143449418 n=1 Tax=Clavelina lepadiformis TaxID=159417 RepID=UPI00404293F4